MESDSKCFRGGGSWELHTDNIAMHVMCLKANFGFGNIKVFQIFDKTGVLWLSVRRDVE